MPVIWTVSFGSSTSSSTGARSNEPLPLTARATIVIVKSPTAGKSSPDTAVPLPTETVTTAWLANGTPFSVAVTVILWLLPAGPSRTRSGDTVSNTPVDGDSSSEIVSVWSVGSITPRSFSPIPDTVTLLSLACTSLSTARSVTELLLLVLPAGIVRVVPPSVKSSSTAGATGCAETVIVVRSLDGWLSVAVTRLEPPFSRIVAGVSTSVAAGVASLSVMVSSSPAEGSTASRDTRPVKRSVSSGSSIESSTGTRSNVASPLVSFAGMVRAKLLTGSKSSPCRAVTPATESVTSVSSVRVAAFNAAVTVTVRAAPTASSATASGAAVRVTVDDAASSSAIVISAPRTSRPGAVPFTISVSPSPSSTKSSRGERSNVP